MKKLTAFFLSMLMVIMLFTSCSSEGSLTSPGNSDSSYKSESMNGSITDGKDYVEETPAEDDTTVERKVIKTYRIRMETLLYDEATARISSAVTQFGGYIAAATQEGSGVSESSSRRTATYTVRIPADRADAYIEHISDGYNVLGSSLTTEDVTDSYYNLQSRLDSLVVQEARLMEMLTQAYFDEMIQLEDKLSDVRAQINELHARLQLMDKSVEYSYIYITLYEVKEYVAPKEETYISRLGSSFIGAFERFAQVIGEIFIIFVWLLPYILVLALVVVIVIFCTKWDRRRKHKNIKKKESETQTERNDQA